MRKELKFEDFELKLVLGRGAFGKVYLANLKMDKKDKGKLYAVKCIRKDLLIEENKIKSTELEKKILLTFKHPFLARMDYLFQDELRLYFVMPFIRGAELYKHSQNRG